MVKLVEEEVETLVYNPQSYLEHNLGFDFDASYLKSKRHRHVKSKRPQSLIDLNGFHYKKETNPTEHSKRSISNTIVKRCESVGEHLKSIVRRTPSLDVLFKNKHNRRKSFDDIKDNKQKTAVSRSKVLQARHSNINIGESTFCVNTLPRTRSEIDYAKYRSKSLSDYLVNESTRSIVKSQSYDNAGFKIRHRSVDDHLTYGINQPTIKIELVDRKENVALDYNLNILLSRNGSTKSSVGSCSNSSLLSSPSDTGIESDNEHFSSDCSSVYVSENSVHTKNNHLYEIVFDQDRYAEEKLYCRSLQRNKRPKSFIGLINSDDVDVDTLTIHVSQNNITTAADEIEHSPLQRDKETVFTTKIISTVGATSQHVSAMKQSPKRVSLTPPVSPVTQFSLDNLLESRQRSLTEPRSAADPRSMTGVTKNNYNSDIQQEQMNELIKPMNETFFMGIKVNNVSKTDENSASSNSSKESLKSTTSCKVINRKEYSSVFQKIFKKGRTRSLPPSQCSTLTMQRKTDFLRNRKCVHIESFV